MSDDMNGLPRVVVAWVKDTRKLFHYTLVTEGPDAGWAYEVTMTPMDAPPASGSIDGIPIKEVADHVELTQQVRASIGLSRVTTKILVQSAIWKLGGAAVGGAASALRGLGVPLPSVKGGGARVPGSWREYRYGHAKYTG